MKTIFSILLGLLLSFGTASITECRESQILVKVFSNHNLHNVSIHSPQPFKIFSDATPNKTQTWPAHKSLTIGPKLGGFQGNSIRLVPQNNSPLIVMLSSGSRKNFDTPLILSTHKNKIVILSSVPLEDYVNGVLAAEMPNSFPMEALKAQAVLIRTKARRHERRHDKEGFDFCDTTHCQVYRPSRNIPHKFRSAVKQTSGIILTHRGKAIDVLYHSTCGGHTSANHRVFGGKPLAYLQGVSDGAFCSDSPHYEWEASLSLKKLKAALNSSQDIQGIHVSDQDPKGRVFQLNYQDPNQANILAQNFLLQIGRKFGWNQVKSALFIIQKSNQGYYFKGKGLGHGVGLCQWGARGMARQGTNFREILMHYYPGTRLQRIA